MITQTTNDISIPIQALNFGNEIKKVFRIENGLIEINQSIHADGYEFKPIIKSKELTEKWCMELLSLNKHINIASILITNNGWIFIHVPYEVKTTSLILP